MYFPHRFKSSVVSFKQSSVKYEVIMSELPHHWWILTAVRVDWKNHAARERLHLFSRLLTRRSLAILKWNEADSSSYCSVWAPVFQRSGLVKMILSWSLSFRRLFIDVLLQVNGSAWRFSLLQTEQKQLWVRLKHLNIRNSFRNSQQPCDRSIISHSYW